MISVGLIVNPLAGVGGPAGLKGSDGVAAEAIARGSVPQAAARAERALASLGAWRQQIEWLSWGGVMGDDVLRASGLAAKCLGAPDPGGSSADDTAQAVAAFAAAGVDALLFVGGDGTARDVLGALRDARAEALPVLGIPAGVKMHSGVFAVTPEAAADVLKGVLDGALIGIEAREVRDIDEAGYRQGVVRTRHFGELQVPTAPRWVQQTKVSGRESEPLVLDELGAWIRELVDPDDYWVFGPGSTTAAILEHLGHAPTLLGVDVVHGGECVLADASAIELESLLAPHGERARIVLTAIGGQGHVLGRGNQQFTPQLLRRLDRERLMVVATRSKLAGLEGRPLLLDSGDPALDRDWAGRWPILVGYDDAVLYRVGDGGHA